MSIIFKASKQDSCVPAYLNLRKLQAYESYKSGAHFIE